MANFYYIFNSDLGDILLVGNFAGLTNLAFLNTKNKKRERYLERLVKLKKLVGHKKEIQQKKTIFSDLIKQLKEYLSGKREKIDYDLNIREGSVFDRLVWQKICEIPYGETRSYKWVAEQINRPRAIRAVANAIARNPVAILIPCHRVIRADGKIGGYRYGLRIKKKLLKLEGVKVK